MILTITANPLLDHVCNVAITPGEHHRIDRFVAVAGGKGINVARVLAAHGHEVQALFFAGGRTGEALAELVAADGVTAVPVATAAATRIGFLAVNPYGRPPTAVLEPGFAVSPREIGSFMAQVRRRLVGADLVICGGSVSHPDAESLWRMVCDACTHARVPCWVDAYGPAMDACLTGANPPALAKPNRQEYGRGGRRWAAPAELHRTDGDGQVVVRTPTMRITATPPRIDEVNPVGSGDCYVAALAHARLAGWPLDRQVAYAVAAGAANAARADVARIGPRDIAPLADRVEVVTDRGRPT